MYQKFAALLVLLLCAGMLHAAKHPIYRKNKVGGGLLGYDRVDAELVTVSGNLMWDINCANPGLSWCKRPAGGIAPPDEDAIDLLTIYADQMIGTGTLIGTHSITETQGANTVEYSLSWTASSCDPDAEVEVLIEKEVL